MTLEVEQLHAALEGLRASVLKKLSGLGEEDARRSTVGSRTNLAGLVQHLTFVESLWFEVIVAGRKTTRDDRSMRVDPSVSLRTLRAEYRAAYAASDEIIAVVGDADAPVTRTGLRAIFGGCCSRSSRRPPASHGGTPTSSASRSTARQAAEPGLHARTHTAVASRREDHH